MSATRNPVEGVGGRGRRAPAEDTERRWITGAKRRRSKKEKECNVIKENDR